MASNFIVGELYSRENVAERISLPIDKRKGGDWATGYSEWNGAAYIFANIGSAGRTGHDYPNQWEGKNLIWSGKTRSSPGQPQIERLITNTQPVHIFWRAADREAFAYAGQAKAIAVHGDQPVRVTWSFEEDAGYPAPNGALESVAQVPHFEREFERFRLTIYPRFSDGPFTSFHDGAARQWESYKQRVREVALGRLGAERWTLQEIGSGALLDRLIAAIEIDGDDQNRNNLVPWQGRYGLGSAAHAALVAARRQPAASRRFEVWLFDAFVARSEPEPLFEQFRALAGDGYPLAAYVFFLLDIDRYAPIAPKTFDRAFKQLGIDLTTSGRCSWSNYTAYNDAIGSVRRELAKKPRLEGVRHIDAHSFCWMLVRMADEIAEGSKSAGIVRHASVRLRAIYTMADNAAHAANQSGKQTLSTKKIKEIHHTREELVKIIDVLSNEQKGLCALTELPMQWRGDHEDGELCASLDRIDSSGDYEKSNLQVVCWFANRWKGAAPDGEFRRLIAMLRNQSCTSPDKN
jgi:hypothetical protein